MKTILAINGKHKRSPLMEEYYCELSKHFNLIRETNTHIPVEELCKEHGIPDYIYWGFTIKGIAVESSVDFINSNKIPVIIDPGDPDLFTKDRMYTKPFWNIKTIKYIIARWPFTENYPMEEQLLKFMENGYTAVDLTKLQYGDNPSTFLSSAKLIHVPWGINPENYPEPDYDNKDIDVAYLCTRGDSFERHNNRNKVYDLLMDMRNINLRIGTYYEPYYTDILKRSKIFIVEGSGINFLTQKYLQSAMAGCLLMGDQPLTGDDVFYNDTMHIILNWDRLEEGIRWIQRHGWMARGASELCRDRVIENFSIDKVVKELTEALK